MNGADNRHRREADARTESRHNDDVILSEMRWIKEAIIENKVLNSREHENLKQEIIITQEAQKITNGNVIKLKEWRSTVEGASKIVGILIIPVVLAVAYLIVDFWVKK